MVLSQKSATIIAGAVRSVDQSPDLAEPVSEDRTLRRWALGESAARYRLLLRLLVSGKITANDVSQSHRINTILLIAIGLLAFTIFPRLTRVLGYPVVDALLSVGVIGRAIRMTRARSTNHHFVDGTYEPLAPPQMGPKKLSSRDLFHSLTRLWRHMLPEQISTLLGGGCHDLDVRQQVDRRALNARYAVNSGVGIHSGLRTLFAGPPVAQRRASGFPQREAFLWWIVQTTRAS